MKPSPSDRIHKHFSFTSTSCPTAEGFEFLLGCDDLARFGFKLVETRHHYIFEGDICREVLSWGGQSLNLLRALPLLLYYHNSTQLRMS